MPISLMNGSGAIYDAWDTSAFLPANKSHHPMQPLEDEIAYVKSGGKMLLGVDVTRGLSLNFEALRDVGTALRAGPANMPGMAGGIS